MEESDNGPLWRTLSALTCTDCQDGLLRRRDSKYGPPLHETGGLTTRNWLCVIN